MRRVRPGLRRLEKKMNAIDEVGRHAGGTRSHAPPGGAGNAEKQPLPNDPWARREFRTRQPHA